MVTQEQN